MLQPWFDRIRAEQSGFNRALKAHHTGSITGRFSAVPDDLPRRASTRALSIHFWTPHPWPSVAKHVEMVLPYLRAEATALGLRWRITSGPELPQQPVDWLLCLKAVPPRRRAATERTVLLLNDGTDRFWSRLRRFDYVFVISSPVLASLVGSAHPRVWFVEETEPLDIIAQGERALVRLPPSKRPPRLLWHGRPESLDGLFPLRATLETFAQGGGVELTVVTNQAAATEQWGALRVRFVDWSAEALAELAAEARLGIVPARPPLAESYLKSAGRVRSLFALGCPAIGDSRSPDVTAFSDACGLPSATVGAQWLAALRQLWHEPMRLDETARRGHALVREQYSVLRTARQWLWFFCTAENEPPPASRA
ncbi:MAG: hypothetical protein ACHQRJ_25450 [Alphaproteobacteria bacterium]